ncbi:hypothetical protein GOV09_01970 [Candidatus Woesearchaeota archaeon]|nr:hypothetical protein [Candidatus Woesearchaeota archaeon]
MKGWDGAYCYAPTTLGITFILNGIKMEGYFDEDYMNDHARNMIKCSRENTHKIDKEMDRSRKAWKFLEQIFAKVDYSDMEAIKASITELDKGNKDMWDPGVVADHFDPHGEEFLQEELKRQGIKMDKQDLIVMLRPSEMTYYQQFKLALLKAFFKKDTSVVDLLVKEYFFIDNSWESAKILTADDFRKRYDELKEDISDAKLQFEDLQNDWKSEQKKIITKYNLPKEMQNIFHLYQQLFFLRDERKKYVQLLVHHLSILYTKLSEILDIPFETLSLINSDAFTKDMDRESILEICMRRKNYFASAYQGDKNTIFEGDDAKALAEELQAAEEFQGKVITGQTACGGKAKGLARIVIGETHFGKFMEGDILVAPMTRPEYVPLMKKAKAIITDEGGITCHAAVISRELKVPCVIGTKIATKVLKDNDMIEVDADKGTITILDNL